MQWHWQMLISLLRSYFHFLNYTQSFKEFIIWSDYSRFTKKKSSYKTNSVQLSDCLYCYTLTRFKCLIENNWLQLQPAEIDGAHWQMLPSETQHQVSLDAVAGERQQFNMNAAARIAPALLYSRIYISSIISGSLLVDWYRNPRIHFTFFLYRERYWALIYTKAINWPRDWCDPLIDRGVDVFFFSFYQQTFYNVTNDMSRLCALIFKTLFFFWGVCLSKNII